MSDRAHAAVGTPTTRPLVACEPHRPPGGTRPETHYQLVLPLHRPADPDPVPDEPVASPLPPPGPRELRSLLTALIEVTTGRRYPTRLRAKVSEDLYQALRQPQRRPPGSRYVLGPVHGQRTVPHILEVCATAYGPARALATLARWEARWHGWICIRFEVLLPPDAGGRRHRRTSATAA